MFGLAALALLSLAATAQGQVTAATNYNPVSIVVNSAPFDIIATPITPAAPYPQNLFQCNVTGDTRFPPYATGTYPLNISVPVGQRVRVIFANGNLNGATVTQQGEPGVIVQQGGSPIVQQAGGASPIVQRVGSPVVQQSTPSPAALVVQQSPTVVQQPTYPQAPPAPVAPPVEHVPVPPTPVDPKTPPTTPAPTTPTPTTPTPSNPTPVPSTPPTPTPVTPANPPPATPATPPPTTPANPPPTTPANPPPTTPQAYPPPPKKGEDDNTPPPPKKGEDDNTPPPPKKSEDDNTPPPPKKSDDDDKTPPPPKKSDNTPDPTQPAAGRKLLQDTVPGGPNNGLVEYVALASANTVPGFFAGSTQFGVPYVEFTATEAARGQVAIFKGVLESAQVVGGVPLYPFRPNPAQSPECQVNVNFKVL